jgi:hypothetical protein
MKPVSIKPRIAEESLPSDRPQNNRPLIETLKLGSGARDALHRASDSLASAGGPDTPGAQDRSRVAARRVYEALRPHEREKLAAYEADEISALVFDGLVPLEGDSPPDVLPSEAQLQREHATRYYASRNQALLQLLGERAFAFDVENGGRITRLVADFERAGTRAVPLGSAPVVSRLEVAPALEATGARQIERSSHRGTLLGAHSEGPYYATRYPTPEHSPAPSTLLLAARWNPAHQPTQVLPLKPILGEIEAGDALNCALHLFRFTKSDSYLQGAGAPRFVPLLDLYPDGTIAFRMNVHRAQPEEDAPESVKQSFNRVLAAIARMTPAEILLSPERAIAIRNTRCLHGREAISDPRRLLIRLFGYASNVHAHLVQADPFIVKG